MGRLAQFGKVTVRVYGNDHPPAHFHINGPDFAALVDIGTLTIIRGSVPAPVWRDVLAWVTENRMMLVEEWNRCNPRVPIG